MRYVWSLLLALGLVATAWSVLERRSQPPNQPTYHTQDDGSGYPPPDPPPTPGPKNR